VTAFRLPQIALGMQFAVEKFRWPSNPQARYLWCGLSGLSRPPNVSKFLTVAPGGPQKLAPPAVSEKIFEGEAGENF